MKRMPFLVCSNCKKNLLVANLPVTLRYISVICPGIRSESNLFQTFGSLAGMKHSLL